MVDTIENLLPSAKDLMQELALAEADKAAAEARELVDAEAEQNALIAQLMKPSGISDEEAIKRGVEMIRRAVSAGKLEVQVYRFPNQLCTDHGRAINQSEPGWEKTLTGVPKEIFLLWEKYFRPQGYKLKVRMVEFPGGMPGDIAMVLAWGEGLAK